MGDEVPRQPLWLRRDICFSGMDRVCLFSHGKHFLCILSFGPVFSAARNPRLVNGLQSSSLDNPAKRAPSAVIAATILRPATAFATM